MLLLYTIGQLLTIFCTHILSHRCESLHSYVRKQFSQIDSEKFLKSLKELWPHFNDCICWNITKKLITH